MPFDQKVIEADMLGKTPLKNKEIEAVKTIDNICELLLKKTSIDLEVYLYENFCYCWSWWNRKIQLHCFNGKCFIEAGQSPILLVDADPDQNLAEMLGVDLKEAGKSTIAELIVSTFIEKGGTTVGIPPTERIESSIWEKGLVRKQKF